MKTIKVLSAMSLSSDQINKIEKHFSRNNKEEVQFDYAVDPSLLGGITVTDGNTVYDSSLKGKLGNIKQFLK